MAFTAAELANISNAALDFYVRGPALSQVIQERPTYDRFRRKQKTFSGGKDYISMPVKGEYTTDIAGYTHDDSVSFSNPANIKRVQYSWKEIHAGISMTLTELKKDGISVVDSNRSERTTNHSRRELHVLTGLLQDKLEDMAEGWARGFTRMLWEDGSQDSKEVPGILALIKDNPASGTVGGLSQASNTWWRNRARTSTSSGGTITSAVADGGALIKVMHTEYRQLRRYGGRPNYAPAGSDFLDALATELRANGNYSEVGFSAKSVTDISVADIRYKDIQFVYEPALDDIGRAKYCYVIDDRHLYLDTMEGEDMKQHTPTRPPEKYVMYRAMTWTGGLCADMLNCHGVYAIA